MKIIKCKAKGHYFDIDEYDVCPLCGSEGVVSEDFKDKSPERPKSKSRGLIKWKKKGDKETKRSSTQGHEEHTLSPKISDNQFEFYMKTQEPEELIEKSEDGETRGFFNNEFPQNNHTSYDIPLKIRNEEKEETKDQETKDEAGLLDIQNEIKAVSASSDEKTTGYFVSKNKYQNDSSLEYQDIFSETPDPVVGWLVCISENNFGKSFNIYSGNNSIGRNNENRIVLSRDSSISRLNHAFIAFDPKNCLFYVRPGDGSGLVYVNGDLVNSFFALRMYDILELGNTKLMFISLCNENFSWEKYINSES